MWLAQAQGPQDIFLQYGAIGTVALLALLAVAKLFARQVMQHERDIARADKAEEQLNELNVLIRDQLVASLTRATDVIGRATDVIGRVTEILDDQRRK
jgi:hypothetical protein